MKRQLASLVALLTAAVLGNIASAADPPLQDMLLWVKADAGVISDAQGVATWEDQSGNNNDAIRTLGTMQLTTAGFGNGSHDVIRFNKDGFFALDSAPLRVQDLTIYAVAEQTDQERRAIFSTYSNAINFGYGYHLDMEGPNTRAFTSAGNGATISDWIIPGPSAGMHSITAAISATNGSKTLYSDGAVLGSTAVPGISYFDAPTASIGALGQLQIDHFYFRGDIAEILVYSSVDSAQRAAVESYLSSKYFVPEPSSIALLAIGILSILHFRRK